MGKNCLMATIPMKWIKKQKLKKGDFLEIEEVENYLLISSRPLPKEKEISLNFKKPIRSAISRTLQILYDSGFNNINIKFSDQKVLSQINWAVNFLEGWRIKEISKNTCKIESTQMNDFDFKNYFRRIFLKVKELPFLYSKYLNGEEEILDEIKIEYDLIMKGSMEIKRKINLDSLPQEYKYYYFIAIQFEEIADHYEFFLRYLNNKKISAEIKNMNKKLGEMLEEVYSNFYKFTIDNFFDFHKEVLWKNFESEKDSLLVYHLRAISERIKNIEKYSVGICLKST